MHTTILVLGIGSWLAFLAGLVVLATRLRNLSTLSLLVSAGAIAVWALGGEDLIRWLAYSPPTGTGLGTSAADALSAIDQSDVIRAACEALLLLWFAVSFLLSAISIGPKRKT